MVLLNICYLVKSTCNKKTFKLHDNGRHCCTVKVGHKRFVFSAWVWKSQNTYFLRPTFTVLWRQGRIKVQGLRAGSKRKGRGSKSWSRVKKKRRRIKNQEEDQGPASHTRFYLSRASGSNLFKDEFGQKMQLRVINFSCLTWIEFRDLIIVPLDLV